MVDARINDSTASTSESVPPKVKKQKSVFEKVQVFDLSRHNFDSALPYVLDCLQNADLISIDLEFSGLGQKPGLMARSIEDRYAAYREAAQTRSILSLGLAFFKWKIKAGSKRVKLNAQVFNILSLCADPFTIEPDSMDFLSKHKFDFNKLIEHGVKYHPIVSEKACTLRSLMNHIFCSGAPLALHNGFMDLCYIYQHFYAPLPEKLGDFVSDLYELWPQAHPMIDSKYLAEFVTRMKASYLEYVFRKCQRENVIDSERNKVFFQVKFPKIESLDEMLRDCSDSAECLLPQNFPRHDIPMDLKLHMCENYLKYHGFCRDKSCTKLHDVDYALDVEMKETIKTNRRRKRRYEHVLPDGTKTDDPLVIKSTGVTLEEIRSSRSQTAVHGTHRAGIDAFMTGFSAIFQNRLNIYRTGKLNPEWCSRIPLSGKNRPLQLMRSNYSNNSQMHCLKIPHIAAERARRRGGDAAAEGEALGIEDPLAKGLEEAKLKADEVPEDPITEEKVPKKKKAKIVEEQAEQEVEQEEHVEQEQEQEVVV